MGSTSDGIQIGGGTGSGTAGVTVRGLAVVNFPREGLQFDTDGTVVITGCHVGVRANGTTKAGNRKGTT